MKKFNVFRSALFLAVVLIFTSCAKDGETGPQGPPGVTGPQGPQGVAGPAGPIGTANVIYSNWVDVSFDPATDQAGQPVLDPDTGEPVAWFAEIDAPKLSNDILTKGEIKVYLNVGTAAEPTVVPLPLTDFYSLFGVLSLNAFYSLNTISLVATDDASTGTTQQGAKVFQYRYVLIPGGAPARMATVDWNNYEAVKKYLNLKD